MGLAAWIFAGLIVGWISYIFWPKSAFGALANVAIAALGGLLGGFLATLLFPSVDPLYNITGESFFMAALVALIFLISFRIAATQIRLRRQRSFTPPEKGTTS